MVFKNSNKELKIENRNIALQVVFELLTCLTLLFVGGTVWQSLLLYCGLSSAEIGLLAAIGSIAQVVAMILDLLVADKIHNPLLTMTVSSVPILMFFSAIFAMCIIGEHVFTFPLLFCANLIYYIAYGFRSIFSYKIPYLLFNIEKYGQVVAISGIVSNLLCVAFTIVINYLLKNFDYLSSMKWLYAVCSVFSLIIVFTTVWMKPIKRQEKTENVKIKEVITDKSVTKLSLANFLRGISMGIINVITLIAAFRYEVDSATLSILASLTTIGALLGNFIFSVFGKPKFLSKLCLISSVALFMLAPVSVLCDWKIFAVIFVFIQIAFILINGLIPVMIAQSTSYRIIGGCTAVRMMVTMAGSALSGWFTGVLLDVSDSKVLIPVILMIIAGVTQLYCGIDYYKYEKTKRSDG